MDDRSSVPAAEEGVTSKPWSVHVVATTVEGTACALECAKRLTSGLDARVVLVVPSRQLSAASRNDPLQRESLVDRYRAVAAEVGVHVTAMFCVCRRVDDIVRTLSASSLAIIGGRRRLWWPTDEERLTARLVAAGYAVAFADVAARPHGIEVPALAC